MPSESAFAAFETFSSASATQAFMMMDVPVIAISRLRLKR